MKTGTLRAGHVPSELATRAGRTAVTGGTDRAAKTNLPKDVHIPSGEDEATLILLDADARPATNKETFRILWDMEDTAGLL
jgi:hypothetical protein